MHTFSEMSAGVPAFLAKLWRLVEDPETNNLICWSKDGRNFIIQNQAQFARELLPLNYKHNNMASFIRQLNMYGFHKITSIDNGGLKFDRDEMEFTHPCFKRNCPHLLEHIKRKIASAKSVDEKSPLKPEAVTKVLQDVKAMRGRQDSLDSRLSVMKQENEALWREIASLRQKHAKQQQIVNKLIQFLITIVQPQRNMSSVRRHMQLMINDIPEKSKIRNASESGSECGPVIHELGEELMDEVPEVEQDLLMPNSPRIGTPATPTSDPDATLSPHNIERPQSSVSTISQNIDFSNQSAEDTVIYLTPRAGETDDINVGLIHTVDNDGSKIFYHITEVPDAQPQETHVTPASYSDENVLTTPMVREEMARSQLLKENNRRRHIKNADAIEDCAEESGPSSTKRQHVASINQQQHEDVHEVPAPMPIKSEPETAIDPMIFLNGYPPSRSLTPNSNLISPNINESECHSNPNTTSGFLTSSSKGNDYLDESNSDLYNPNNFITDDIPADIFDDNSLASIKDSNNVEQNQFRRYALNGKKLLAYLSGSTPESRNLQPSTSAAAAAAATSSTNTSNSNNDAENMVNKASSQAIFDNENGGNKAYTNYKDNQDFMRDEVSDHLHIVQDELEGLKDLLRSDVYSLDNNTLLGTPLSEINSVQTSKSKSFESKNHQIYLPPAMEEDILNKLFNDSNILEPYSLHLSDGTEHNDKKGSELAICQPMYDLSDMINDQSALDVDDVNMPNTSVLPSQQQLKQEFNNSVLNTPYHE